MEEWKAIDKYPQYNVSNFGNIKRGDKLLKISFSKNGYPVVCLGGVPHSIHRLVLIAFVGEPNGLICNHKDGNKANNNLENLEWTTYSRNNKHAYDIGLKNKDASWLHTGEVETKRIAAIKSPEARQKTSNSVKSLWANPDYAIPQRRKINTAKRKAQ